MARASTQGRISRGSGTADADRTRVHAVGGAQQLVERGDVRAAGQRHRHPIRASWTQPDHPARPEEQFQDVRRVIRERIRWIVTSRHDAAVPAALGLDAPSKKLGWILLHDAPLPGLQDDRTLMLSAGSVLGKQNRPGVGIRVDDRDATAPKAEARCASSTSTGNCTGGDGRGGRSRTCTSLRTEDFKSSAAAVTPRPQATKS